MSASLSLAFVQLRGVEAVPVNGLVGAYKFLDLKVRLDGVSKGSGFVGQADITQRVANALYPLSPLVEPRAKHWRTFVIWKAPPQFGSKSSPSDIKSPYSLWSLCCSDSSLAVRSSSRCKEAMAERCRAKQKWRLERNM
jgi:hypothetical protein